MAQNTEGRGRHDTQREKLHHEHEHTNVFAHSEKRCQIITIDSRIATT